MARINTVIIVMLSLIIIASCDENCKIQNCEKCHKGFMGEACDQCKDGYGDFKKAFGDDICMQCSSVIPHCIQCNNPRVWWICSACEPGYKLINNPTGNDICTNDSISVKSEGLEFLN